MIDGHVNFLEIINFWYKKRLYMRKALASSATDMKSNLLNDVIHHTSLFFIS